MKPYNHLIFSVSLSLCLLPVSLSLYFCLCLPLSFSHSLCPSLFLSHSPSFCHSFSVPPSMSLYFTLYFLCSRNPLCRRLVTSMWHTFESHFIKFSLCCRLVISLSNEVIGHCPLEYTPPPLFLPPYIHTYMPIHISGIHPGLVCTY